MISLDKTIAWIQTRMARDPRSTGWSSCSYNGRPIDPLTGAYLPMFKVGDVVVLKSGGPDMTVSRIGHGRFGDQTIFTDWFKAGDKPSQGDFAPESLRPAQKSQTEVNDILDFQALSAAKPYEQQAVIAQPASGKTQGGVTYIHPDDLSDLLQSLPLGQIVSSAWGEKNSNDVVIGTTTYRQSIYMPRKGAYPMFQSPILQWSGHDFFFVQYSVYVRKSDSKDEWKSFPFPKRIVGIHTGGEFGGVEVTLVTGEKHIITGGPDLGRMWTTLFKA